MCHMRPPVYAMGGIHPTTLAFLLLNKLLLLPSPLDIRIPRSNRGSSGLGRRDCGRRAKRSGSRTANSTIGARIGIHRWRQRGGLQS